MSKVKIEIDTEPGNLQSAHELVIAARKAKIGLVSSITLTPELDKAFRDGVNDSLIKILPKKDKVGYKKGDPALVDTILRLIQRTDLLVTVGGTVAYEAAAAANVTEFLSLVGNTPVAPPDGFWGGVSLECIASNADRIDYLVAKGIPKDQIFLFCNPNSAMNQDETDLWKSLTTTTAPFQIFPGGVNPSTGTNDASVYGANFTDIGSNASIRAIVVSADPFFQDTKEKLITAAKTWLDGATTRYICYPSQSYLNKGGTAPKSGQSTLFGPNIEDAYNLLGQLAVSALKVNSRQALVRLKSYPHDV